MYRVIVNVSGRRARLVPEGHKLAVAERDFGEVSAEDAMANKDSLEDGIRSLLADKGITNGDTYTVELPDVLVPARERENTAPASERDSAVATKAKGPVTKPVNPKEGEKNSATNQPENLDKQAKDLKPKQEQSPPSDKDIKDGETAESKQQNA